MGRKLLLRSVTISATDLHGRITMYKRNFLISFLFIFLGGAVDIPILYAIEISDIPLEIQLASPPPNVMLIWDDSVSMDAEFMTSETQGLFEQCYYLFPESAYRPNADFARTDKCVLDERKRRLWHSQWSEYNTLYYSPDRIYKPWRSTANLHFGPANLHHPWSHPMRTEGENTRLAMAEPFFILQNGNGSIVILNAHYFVQKSTIRTNGRENGSHVYLVTWQDADGDGNIDISGQLLNDQRLYFRYVDDGDSEVESDELVRITDSVQIDRLRPLIMDAHTHMRRYQTDKEELQNFANWFTYHRKREFAAKAGAVNAIAASSEQYIGIYALNSQPRISVLPVRAHTLEQASSERSESTTNRQILYSDRSELLIEALYSSTSKGDTLLRKALYNVGTYFDQRSTSELGGSPIKTEKQGGSCQRNYAVAITDGFWNGVFSGVGNTDGIMGPPYQDSWSDTLADIAVKFYENDLAPDLPDLLPALQCDSAQHQHMVTHTLAFGINGTIDMYDVNVDGIKDDPSCIDDPCFLSMDTPFPQWPQPSAGMTTTIDDLWHAAVNGRGRYLNVDHPEALSKAIAGILENNGSLASTAGLAVGGLKFGTDSIIYQTRFRSDNWTGDVFAYTYGTQTDFQDAEDKHILWHASDQLQSSPDLYDLRRIITYGGVFHKPQGVPFRYVDLSESQKALLGSDLANGSIRDLKARNILNYIRGLDDSNLRKRAHMLGDIVHSTPIVVGQTLFVGANDGMLHAFDVRNGKERFAYVPNLVFDHLAALSAPDYQAHHRFYVDATPFAGDVVVGPYLRHTYLLGGLGKGGKGYYCLHIGTRHRDQVSGQFGPYQTDFNVDDIDARHREDDLAKIVMWEYPRPDMQDDLLNTSSGEALIGYGNGDPDIGYSFGQGFCVNANTSENTYRPVAIFSNGYNSSSGKAVLYVLNAKTGDVLRKIDTGVGGDNGLSAPALIDVNLDRCVDYVFAGDLKGNLWKFDLTSDVPEEWGVAYGSDNDINGVIDAAQGDTPMPLFQANEQSITGRPDVMAMTRACAPGAPGYMVIFGTGKFLGSSDRFDVSQQTIYGIWDYGDDSDDFEYLGTIEDRTTGQLSCGLRLAPRHVDYEIKQNDNTYRVLTPWQASYTMVKDNEDRDGSRANNTYRSQGPDPAQYAGWYLDFPMAPTPHATVGERATADIIIRDGKAIVVSFAPATEYCHSGGTSWIYLLDGYGESQVDPDHLDLVQLPRRYDTRISAPVQIFKSDTNPQLDVIVANDQKGRLIKQDFIGEKWGRVFWRQNLFDD